MKNTALILNAVLFVLVAVLFYLHFSDKNKVDTSKPRVEGVRSVGTENASSFRIGYFDWDSVVTHFELFKEMKSEVNAKEESNSREKMRLRQVYQNKINSYNRDLSQTESEQAAQEIKNLEMDITNKMQKLDQEYQELQMRKNNEVKSKIEEYLKDYNKSKGYSFVMAYEPNIIFYRDTTYDITSDLIKGLNEQYVPKKSKKK